MDGILHIVDVLQKFLAIGASTIVIAGSIWALRNISTFRNIGIRLEPSVSGEAFRRDETLYLNTTVQVSNVGIRGVRFSRIENATSLWITPVTTVAPVEDYPPLLGLPPVDQSGPSAFYNVFVGHDYVKSGATLSLPLVIPIPAEEDIVALKLILYIGDANRQLEWEASCVVTVNRV